MNDCLPVHYDALMDLFQAKVSETETLSKKFSSVQSTVKRLQSDKADLLQLINILSSAPMPAKNVLEAYFSKLAGDDDNVLSSKSVC